MASEKIDELQLQIGSDASGAIKEIGNIASALDIAAASAQRFASASTLLNRFASGMERLANVDLNNAISGLQTLSKLDLSNLKDKKVNIDLTVNGADRVDRLAYASDQAAKSMSKNASDMAKTLGQEYKMPTKAVTELTGLVKDYLKALSIGDTSGVMDAITSHIESNTRKSAADIMGLTNQYKAFIDYVNNMKISPGSNTDSNTRDLFTALGLERQLENGATPIDTWWQEDSFKAVAAGIGDTLIDLTETNPENMFLQLAGAVDYCRTALNTYWSDAETTAQINENVGQSLDGLRDAYNEKVNKNMANTKNAIPLDLSVDKARFHKNIQDAIYEVTKLPFKSHPITVELNTQQLKQNLEHVISLVDFGKMPQTAQGFKDMSDAISSMNQASMKDTGVTQFTNAMARLMKVDTSKFDVATLGKIIDHIKEMTAIGDIPNSINRFVSALARLANAGDKAKTSSDGLKILIPRLRESVKAFQSVGEVSGSVNQFIAGLASLANAGNKATITAYNLRALTREVLVFLKTLRNAPQINSNLAMTIYGLGNLAAAGQKTGKALSDLSNGNSQRANTVFNALGKAAQSLANDLKKVFSIVLQLGKSGVKALGSFMQKLGLLPSATNGIDRTAISFGNLLRAIVPFYGIRGIFNWAKEATEAGSSIVEVENVINTSFGSLKKGYEDISGYVYNWAESTIDSFGVSELAAKQYAGRLMAMFNSSGFDLTEGMRDSAAKMTTDLIERAGDIASFYDIGVDEAMTKMQAGLAGQVRPLRALGINMSVANMEAFALSRGITTSWQSMDQASQMALRYQYILYATQYAEGDFARTSMSMANQVRLLQLNFQMLSTTIGQGLVSAIAPVISWLNALIRRLIQAAQAFRTFMWTLFGKPLQAAKGVVDEMAGYLDDSADSAGSLGGAGGDAADGLGGASDAAKELKKNLSLLPFDELNQLAKDTNSASSGGGSGSGGGGVGGVGGAGDLGLLPDFTEEIDNSPLPDAINKWAKKIRESFLNKDWVGLGQNIGDMLNSGFKHVYDFLDWNNWKDKVYNFINPFHTTINTMMDRIDWGLVGRTLARGLNDIVYTLRMWINGFDWRRYGQLFALGLNSMLDEWDADAFGRLIADKFKMAWDLFGGWVEKFNFTKLGSKLKEMILGGLDELDWSDMGKTLGGFLNGVSDTINEMLGDGQVRDELADAFSEFVNSFLEEFDEEDAKEALQNIGDTIFGGIWKALKQTDKSEAVGTITTVLSGLPWGGIAAIVGVKAGGALAKGIFGAVFKSKAQEIISGIHFGGSGATTTGATATTSGVTSGIVSATGMSAGSLLAGTGIMGGLLALGVAMRKFADAHGGVQQGANLNTDRSFGTTPTAPKATNAAGYSTQIQTKAIKPSAAATDTSTKVTQFVETILTGKKDQSFANLEVAKSSLLDTPIVQKIMNGELTSDFKDGYKKFTDTKAYNTIKGFGASISSTFQTWWGRNIDKKNYASTKGMGASIGSTFKTWWTRNTDRKNYSSTKSMAASIGSAFQTWWWRNTDQKNYKSTKGMDASPTGTLKTWWGNFVDTGHYLASKWFTATDKGNFSKYTDMWKNLKDKWVDVNVSIVKKTHDLGAWIKGKWEELVKFDWFAKGGLFQSTSLIGVGEAGAEAVLPLTNRRTMKMIGSAISNAGGMSVGGNAELANEIAMRIAPIVISAINGQNERPVNVNAILYTEDNEVLARAVNRGNRSLDKRYNPVAQYT